MLCHRDFLEQNIQLSRTLCPLQLLLAAADIQHTACMPHIAVVTLDCDCGTPKSTTTASGRGIVLFQEPRLVSSSQKAPWCYACWSMHGHQQGDSEATNCSTSDNLQAELGCCASTPSCRSTPLSELSTSLPWGCAGQQLWPQWATMPAIAGARREGSMIGSPVQAAAGHNKKQGYMSSMRCCCQALAAPLVHTLMYVASLA